MVKRCALALAVAAVLLFMAACETEKPVIVTQPEETTAEELPENTEPDPEEEYITRGREFSFRVPDAWLGTVGVSYDQDANVIEATYKDYVLVTLNYVKSGEYQGGDPLTPHKILHYFDHNDMITAEIVNYPLHLMKLDADGIPYNGYPAEDIQELVRLETGRTLYVSNYAGLYGYDSEKSGRLLGYIDRYLVPLLKAGIVLPKGERLPVETTEDSEMAYVFESDALTFTMPDDWRDLDVTVETTENGIVLRYKEYQIAELSVRNEYGGGSAYTQNSILYDLDDGRLVGAAIEVYPAYVSAGNYREIPEDAMHALVLIETGRDVVLSDYFGKPGKVAGLLDRVQDYLVPLLASATDAR